MKQSIVEIIVGVEGIHKEMLVTWGVIWQGEMASEWQ